MKNAEGDAEEVERLLRQQIQLHEEMLDRGRKARWNYHLTQAVKRNLEFLILARLAEDTYRLEAFLTTKELNDDLTIAELSS